MSISPPFDPTRPYNELPDLPPQVDLETVAIYRALLSARIALAELKEACRMLPNPNVLMRAIVLQEAKSSSEIENIVTTHDELFRSFNDAHETQSPHTKEVLRYQEAIWDGYAYIAEHSKIDTPLFELLARVIVSDETRVRSKPGTQVVNRRLKEVVYTPPEGETLLLAKLNMLSKFLSDEVEIDPLIRTALAHYQFEAIHPFPDGNGRTGRVVNILCLVNMQLIKFPVLFLSNFFITHRARYYELLSKVTQERAWEEWICFFLQGICDASTETREKVNATLHCMETISDQIRREKPKIFSKELVEVIFENPYTRISFLEDKGIARRQTASVYLKELEQIGVLTSQKRGRDQIFVNEAFLRILSN